MKGAPEIEHLSMKRLRLKASKGEGGYLLGTLEVMLKKTLGMGIWREVHILGTLKEYEEGL